jgi:hypothetical protein
LGGAEATVEAVEPDHVSARGGQVVTVSGSGLAGVTGVMVGGVEAEIAEVTPDAVSFHSPRLVAGTVDVAVWLPDGEPLVLEDALTVEPLSLTFATGLAELVDAPEAQEIRDAVAFDADLDGDLDLVLATEDGLRVLANDGAGHFTLLRGPVPEPAEPEPPVEGEEPPPDGEEPPVEPATPEPLRPGGRADMAGLAAGDLDGDGTPELVVCTGGGRDLVLKAGAGGLQEAGALPWRLGACRAVSLVHIDRDGLLDVAVALDRNGSVGLEAYVHGSVALELDDALAPPSEEVTPAGTPSSADPAAPLVFERVTDDAASGKGAARLGFTLTEVGPEASFPLPPLDTLPDRLRLQARSDGGAIVARLRVTDAGGQSLDGPELTGLTTSWNVFDLSDLPSLVLPEAPLTAPVTLSVVVTTTAPLPMAGELRIDTIVAEREGHVPTLVDDYERREARYAWPALHRMLGGDLDRDGLSDLVVLTGQGPALLVTRGAPGADEGVPFIAGPLSAGGTGPYVTGALLDVDRDLDLDAVLCGGGQDRLLVGDGWGQLLDATAGSLPVDWSDGRAAATADMDLDGTDDVVIGNHGATDRLYLGVGDGRLLDVTPDFGFDTLETAAVVIADLDGDGDDDAVSVPRSGAERPHVRIAVGEDE